MNRRRYKELLFAVVLSGVLLAGGTANRQKARPVNGELQDTDRKVNIYYVDSETSEIVTKSTEIQDGFDIWSQLQKEGVLSEECGLLSIEVREKVRQIDLDISSDTGDYIRSMGTRGEIEVLGCIINTYLDAYKGEKIRITEESKPLETAHGGKMEGYCEHIDF